MPRPLHCRLLLVTSAIAGLTWFSRPSPGVEPDGLRVALQSPSPQSPSPAGRSTSAGHFADAEPLPFVGVSGCAAANCHGGDGSRGTTGSEYSIWIQEDPHAGAYTVLFNDTSQRMAAALRLDRPAHQAQLCLNCHAPQSAAPFRTASATHSRLLDGVSCESCHGSAARWLGPHVRYDWKRKTAEEKEALGFVNTKDLWTRGRLCADCHVGEPGRDVNHDLYAAGHPRLFFELSAFNANMPAHWDRNDDRRREGSPSSSTFEAKLWAIGQLASMEAATDLLIHRAGSAIDDVPAFHRGGAYPHAETIPVWPELAETGCFACHHDLQTPSWRQQRGYAGRRPGDLPWRTWLSPLVNDVAAAFDSPLTSLSDLQTAMTRPAPDRSHVMELATRARNDLNRLGRSLTARKISPAQVQSLMTAIAQRGDDLAGQNWDATTQAYLALVALHQSRQDASLNRTGIPDAHGREMDRLLKQVLGQLAFPEDSNSPATFDGESVEQLRKSFSDIRTLLNGLD